MIGEAQEMNGHNTTRLIWQFASSQSSLSPDFQIHIVQCLKFIFQNAASNWCSSDQRPERMPRRATGMAIHFWKAIAKMLLEEARLGCSPDPSEAAWFNRNGCPEADVSKCLADLERIAAKAREVRGPT